MVEINMLPKNSNFLLDAQWFMFNVSSSHALHDNMLANVADLSAPDGPYQWRGLSVQPYQWRGGGGAIGLNVKRLKIEGKEMFSGCMRSAQFSVQVRKKGCTACDHLHFVNESLHKQCITCFIVV